MEKDRVPVNNVVISAFLVQEHAGDNTDELRRGRQSATMRWGEGRREGQAAQGHHVVLQHNRERQLDDV